MIGIINYGMGNLASVKNALDYKGIASEIVNDPDQLKNFDKAILPGVGAFGRAMANLSKNSFDQAILDFANSQSKPLLGICLGMQMLLDSSVEHGEFQGLGLVKGKVLDFKEVINDAPIQHVGWNTIHKTESSRLFVNHKDEAAFYFVHRYYCVLDNENEIAAYTDYGIKFHSAIEKDNIFGTQFHPEKSQKDGLLVFNEFARL